MRVNTTKLEAVMKQPADHAMHEHSDQHAEHDRYAGHSIAMFRRKVWIALSLTIPTLFGGTHAAAGIPVHGSAFSRCDVEPAIIGTTVFFYGGLVFVKER